MFSTASVTKWLLPCSRTLLAPPLPPPSPPPPPPPPPKSYDDVGDLLALHDLVVGDDALLEAHDAIGERQQILVVGDDDEGAVVRYLFDHALYLRAAAFVERAGGFIEDEHLGAMVKQRAQQPHHLPLSAGQVAALLANGVEHFLPEATLEIAHAELLQHGVDVVWPQRLVFVREIVPQRPIEQAGMLRNVCDAPPDRVRVDLRGVAPVEVDCARLVALQPKQQLRQRRLATADATHHGEALLCGDSQPEAVKNGLRARRVIGQLILLVRECDVVKLDVNPAPRRDRYAPLAAPRARAGHPLNVVGDDLYPSVEVDKRLKVVVKPSADLQHREHHDEAADQRRRLDRIAPIEIDAFPGRTGENHDEYEGEYDAIRDAAVNMVARAPHRFLICSVHDAVLLLFRLVVVHREEIVEDILYLLLHGVEGVFARIRQGAAMRAEVPRDERKQYERAHKYGAQRPVAVVQVAAGDKYGEDVGEQEHLDVVEEGAQVGGQLDELARDVAEVKLSVVLAMPLDDRIHNVLPHKRLEQRQ